MEKEEFLALLSNLGEEVISSEEIERIGQALEEKEGREALEYMRDILRSLKWQIEDKLLELEGEYLSLAEDLLEVFPVQGMREALDEYRKEYQEALEDFHREMDNLSQQFVALQEQEPEEREE